MATILRYKLDGVLDLTISTKKPEGRLMRYLKRVGKLDDPTAAHVQYRSSLPGKWTLWPHGTGKEHLAENEFKDLPVFYESRYFVDCFFDDPEVTEACVVHPMASVADAFGFSHHMLVGSLDFVNSPGKFRLAIEYKLHGETRSVVLEWLVASEKMDVEHDLDLITQTIKAAHPGLVHAFLAKTLAESGVSLNGGKQDDNVWYALLLKVFNEYRQSVEIIVNRPHLKYVPHAEYLRAERIKRWSPSLANRFNEMDPARREVALFRSERTDPERDTVENRFVLFTLKALSSRLDEFATACAEHDSVSSDYIEKMRERRDELVRLASNPFFKGVGQFSGFKQESLALQRKPGYSKIFASWIVLQQSLDPNECGVDIGYRPISALYEFWCFLTIRNKIAGSTEFKTDEKDLKPIFGDLDDLGDLFDDPDNKAEPSRLNKLVYEFKEVAGGTRKVQLTYQQAYVTTTDFGPLVYINPQRPDIVLTVIDTAKPEGEGVYSYIFDAKYRIRQTKDEESPDETTSEAINAMHQYRDAILYRKQKGDKLLSREIIGAYVLYPGRPKPNSMEYDKVISAENIGAIPLLPAERNGDGTYKFDANGHHGEEALDEFLGKLLKRSTQSDHLGINAEGFANVIPTRGTTVVVAPNTSQYLRDEVVYGTYRSGQLDWIKEAHLYNMPVDVAATIGIQNEADAKAKSMLFLVSGQQGHREKPSVFQIVLGSARKVRQKELVNGYGYKVAGNPDDYKEYWLWELVDNSESVSTS